MKRLFFFLLIILLGGCNTTSPLSTPVSPIPLPDGTVLYFPETGHSIGEPFLSFYRSNNHAALLGYPISEATTVDDWQVQYFQYGQLEIHPENEPAYFITVGWSGLLNHNNMPPQSEKPFIPHGDFAKFYAVNGNSIQFGNAISEPFLANGSLVQDFESARLIWSPSFGEAASTKLAPIGEDYLLQHHLSALLKPLPPPENATIVKSPSPPLPDDATLSIDIEQTTDENFSRVSFSFKQNGHPLVGYATQLQWDTHRAALPPTNYMGETHYLIQQKSISLDNLQIFDAENRPFSPK